MKKIHRIFNTIILCSFFILLLHQESHALTIHEDRAEKVNLAMRQVAHNLLILEKDSISQIPPVIQDGNRFSLEIECLNYDYLPYIINEVFTEFNIKDEYRVIVKLCESEEVKLGYTSQSFNAKNMACQGREMDPGCHRIILHLDDIKPLEENNASIIPMLPMAILLGLSFFGWIWYKNNSDTTIHNGSTYQLGSYSFDSLNQKIFQGKTSQDLTYRENKLLLLLAKNKNSVVERETILAEVWEDEGVIVGRSVDVFISRLRKFFKEDEKVGIKSVHGVGYRLEVA